MLFNSCLAGSTKPATFFFLHQAQAGAFSGDGASLQAINFLEDPPLAVDLHTHHCACRAGPSPRPGSFACFAVGRCSVPHVCERDRLSRCETHPFVSQALARPARQWAIVFSLSSRFPARLRPPRGPHAAERVESAFRHDRWSPQSLTGAAGGARLGYVTPVNL